MQEWFVAAINSEEGFQIGAAQNFANLLSTQAEKAKRLEAAYLARSIPLTTEHLNDPKIVLFPVVGRPIYQSKKNEG
jgi:hypothetical protein